MFTCYKEKDFSYDLVLPEKLRSKLKKPFGKLITYQPAIQLIQIIKKEKPKIVIFVGDYCVKDALDHGLIPDLSIIDGKNLRKPFEKVPINNVKVIKSKNPSATITSESWKKIRIIIQEKLKKTIKEKPNKPVVLSIDGEEDLLVIPAVLESPNNGFVVYGQPHEGIVLIKTTFNKKFKLKKLIKRMKVE